MQRLRYAVLDEYSVLILSLSEPPIFWMAIWEWGISPQEGCFYRRLRKVSDHVDMARALGCAGLVLLGAGFLLSLDIPLESGEDCSTVITTINKAMNSNILNDFDSIVFSFVRLTSNLSYLRAHERPLHRYHDIVQLEINPGLTPPAISADPHLKKPPWPTTRVSDPVTFDWISTKSCPAPADTRAGYQMLMQME
jgi:hypothetical protein